MRKNIVLISICAALSHMSCKHTETEKEEETTFLVTNPLKKDTLITRDYVCQIHAIQHIELRAMEKGFLENIFVDEGQSVKKGQQMFKIMPQIYNAELQKAQAETKGPGTLSSSCLTANARWCVCSERARQSNCECPRAHRVRRLSAC